MKRTAIIFTTLFALAAMPAFAQSRSVDLTGWVTWVDPSGDDTFEGVEDVDDLNLEFDTEQGFGIGINVFWSSRFSTEFAASISEPDLDLRFSEPGAPAIAGSLEMIPITAVLQFHLNPDGRFDPYIGAGAAWVLFDEVQSNQLREIDIDAIDFDDDFGFVVNAGMSIDITPTFAINLDAKYVPVESAARAVFAGVGSDPVEIEINPLILAAGLQIQF
ncbi:MAG: OmpW family protein [Thermoanaerobaculia bacterium]